MTAQPDAPLQQREPEYRAIFEASSDGLVINDVETGLVLEANPAFCQMHGYDRMTGLHPTTFIHRDSYHLFGEYVQAIQAGKEYRARAHDVHRDGTVFDVEVLGRGFMYQGRFALLGVVRDVTEQVRAYEMLEQRVAERTLEVDRRRQVAEALRDLMAVVNSQRTLDEILAHIVAQASQLLGSHASAIYVPVREGGENLLRVGASSSLDNEYVAVRVPVGMPATGLAFARRRPVAVYDIPAALSQHDSTGDTPLCEDRTSHLRAVRLWGEWEELGPRGNERVLRLGAFAEGFRAILAVPLAARAETYGALTLYYREAREFAQDEVWLATAFADQAALAIQNARLYEQAQQTATLQERQRLARELHDAVTQTLFSTALIAEVIPDLWDADPVEGRQRLEELRRLTRGALAEMRTLLVELRPGALTELPLVDLLRQLGEAAAGRSRLEVVVDAHRQLEDQLLAEDRVALYRIAQEALNNTVKHAQARHAWVRLEQSGEAGLSLLIDDDGRGFDPATVPRGHFGVAIMHERAQAIGAALSVVSSPGAGTRIEVRCRPREEAAK